jgi:hypothetical protein
VHKNEMAWQGLKMQHQTEQELEHLRSRHAAFEKDMQRAKDGLMCVLVPARQWLLLAAV